MLFMYLGPKQKQIIFQRRHKTSYEKSELLAGSPIFPPVIIIILSSHQTSCVCVYVSFFLFFKWIKEHWVAIYLDTF